MKTNPKRNNRNEDFNVESKNMFNLCEEHPSYKYMVMSKRNRVVIPSISSVKLLPNINELSLNIDNTNDEIVLKRREKYGQIALLLFYPYRDRDDLKLDGSYWKRYIHAL